MPLLQVRDCPEGLYDELRACAEAERRTIAQQNIVILEKYLHPERTVGVADSSTREARAAKKRAVFQRIKAMGPVTVPSDFPDAAALIREDRDAR